MVRPVRTPVGYLAAWLAFRACTALLRWRIDLEGAEHLPRTGGAVLTWNHTSHLDAPLTAAALLRPTGRWIRFFALRQLWERPLAARVLALAGCVPVDRDNLGGRLAALRRAVEAARDGEVVALAPESRISPSFELLSFRPGAVRIAQVAGVPVVPTASWGTHRFSTSGRPPSVRRGWRLPVTVRVGAPIVVAPDDDLTAASERLHDAMAGLLAECRASYPDGAPAGAWWVPASMGGGAPPPGDGDGGSGEDGAADRD